jgi:16S rRNA G966 N2-methylase RsmD
MDFLNKKDSLRNLSDKSFEDVVEELANQLEKVSLFYEYTTEQLNRDWELLKNWHSTTNSINSTSRLGMKLCEQFFPNFYHIEDNKGRSFINQWNEENLIKVLRWNRKSHSTPYLSELKRGIYFCCGLCKSTMFRPQLAKMIVEHYDAKIVLDPCAGWGGRMLGTVSAGAKYIAFEPNIITWMNLKYLSEVLNIEDKVTLICDDALNMEEYDIPKVDMIITSPPYFDLEIYSHDETQSITNCYNYDNWSERFLKSIIDKSLSYLKDGGVSCWNVASVGKNDMHHDVMQYHKMQNYIRTNQFSIISSKRQALQKINNNKSKDITFVYTKERK